MQRSPSPVPEAGVEAAASRKRFPTWGESNRGRVPDAARVPILGNPEFMEHGNTPDSTNNWMLRRKLDEHSTKLAMGWMPAERSVSPEPVYDSHGKRVNTRDVRYREKFTRERVWMIEAGLQNNRFFKPPADYMPRGTRKQVKVYIPVDEYPDYNFIGLVIGPRGNTQKKLEKELNCKISIRGKGSVKEGRAKHNDPSDNDKLHVLITGDSDEIVNHARTVITDLITPKDDEQNEHKKNQLRELALINGTLRDSDACRFCGGTGHKIWNCPEKTRDWKPANVVCALCGDHGHPTSDCPMRAGARAPSGPTAVRNVVDAEYNQFLQELGGGAPGAGRGGSGAQGGGDADMDMDIDAGPSAGGAPPHMHGGGGPHPALPAPPHMQGGGYGGPPMGRPPPGYYGGHMPPPQQHQPWMHGGPPPPHHEGWAHGGPPPGMMPPPHGAQWPPAGPPPGGQWGPPPGPQGAWGPPPPGMPWGAPPPPHESGYSGAPPFMGGPPPGYAGQAMPPHEAYGQQYAHGGMPPPPPPGAPSAEQAYAHAGQPPPPPPPAHQESQPPPPQQQQQQQQSQQANMDDEFARFMSDTQR